MDLKKLNKSIEIKLTKLEAYQGKYKGVEFKVKKEGGGYYWIVNGTKGGRLFPQENGAVIAAKSYIDSL